MNEVSGAYLMMALLAETSRYAACRKHGIMVVN